MEFEPLPDRLNCYHTGTFSPVVLRFEGGNHHGGFCIEEYKDRCPRISLYGNAEEIKQVWLRCLLELQSRIRNSVRIRTLVDDDWLFFDLRTKDYSLHIYVGDGDYDTGINSDTMIEDATLALFRLRTLYNEFYNANV